jgi:hypothetical protein
MLVAVGVVATVLVEARLQEVLAVAVPVVCGTIMVVLPEQQIQVAGAVRALTTAAIVHEMVVMVVLVW